MGIKSLYRWAISPAEPLYSALRHWLPTTRKIKFNGMFVDIDRKPLDCLFPKYRNIRDEPAYEEALVKALNLYVKSSDTITIVGGGYGVTTCVAARRTGCSGSVICYEGNKENAERTIIASQLNGLHSQIKVRHAIVASDIGVYPGHKSDQLVTPDSLPPCDVLQLDCEGSEIEIIRSLSIAPRIIIVETHGFLGATTAQVEFELRKRNYRVINLGPAEPRSLQLCEKLDIFCLIGILDSSGSTTNASN